MNQIYQDSTLRSKMGVEDEPPCQGEACSLHACLNKNLYTPDKCDDAVKKLYLCCRAMHKRESGAISESRLDWS